MSEPEDGNPSGSDQSDSEEPEYASTPFDHPYFLPVLLLALAVWFGYDGWFNEEMEWKKFNRYGFFGLLAGGLYFGVKARRERGES